MSSRVSDSASIDVRAYERQDAADTLAIFLAAVTETAAADYTAEQIQAWADPDGRERARWNAAMSARRSFVAVVADQVVGFSDVRHDGHIDMMFVAPAFSRRGVARTLLAHVERIARMLEVQEMSADVSITARAFFQSQGFEVVAEQLPVVRGVALTNFRMRKKLTGPLEI